MPFPVKKSAKKHEKASKKSDKAAVKGLKAAGPGHSFAPAHSPAKGKTPPIVDPTKGLREAIKAKEIEALAMQAASGV